MPNLIRNNLDVRAIEVSCLIIWLIVSGGVLGFMLAFILSEAWPYVLAVGGAIVALFFGWIARGNKEEAKTAKKNIKGMEDAKEAREEIESMDDAAARDRARSRLRSRTKR